MVRRTRDEAAFNSTPAVPETPHPGSHSTRSNKSNRGNMNGGNDKPKSSMSKSGERGTRRRQVSKKNHAVQPLPKESEDSAAQNNTINSTKFESENVTTSAPPVEDTKSVNASTNAQTEGSKNDQRTSDIPATSVPRKSRSRRGKAKPKGSS